MHVLSFTSIKSDTVLKCLSFTVTTSKSLARRQRCFAFSFSNYKSPQKLLFPKNRDFSVSAILYCKEKNDREYRKQSLYGDGVGSSYALSEKVKYRTAVCRPCRFKSFKIFNGRLTPSCGGFFYPRYALVIFHFRDVYTPNLIH